MCNIFKQFTEPRIVAMMEELMIIRIRIGKRLFTLHKAHAAIIKLEMRAAMILIQQGKEPEKHEAVMEMRALRKEVEDEIAAIMKSKIVSE